MSAPTGPASRQAAFGLVDQALSSASNFAVVFMVAQSADLKDFGWFTVMYGVVTVGLALNRSALGVPIGVDVELSAEHFRRLVGHSIFVAVLLGAIGGAGLAVIGARGSSPVDTWALVLGCAMPVVLAQDLMRYVAMARQKAQGALVADGLWLLAVAVPWLINLTGVRIVSVSTGLASWLFGAVVSAACLAAVGAGGRPVVSGIRGMVGEPRRMHLAGDALIGAGAPALLAALVALVASAQVAGAWRAATTLMSPLNVLLAAVPLVFLRRAALQGPSGATRTCRRLAAALVVLCSLWGLVLLVLPDRLGRSMMGTAWTSAQPVLPFTIAETAGIAVWTAGVTLLRVLHQTRRALILRIGYAALSLTMGLGAAAITAEPKYVACGLALCAWGVAGALWSTLWPGSAPASPAGQPDPAARA